MHTKAQEARLQGREFQPREQSPHKPLGPLRSYLSKQRSPEAKLYGPQFREKL